MVLDPLYYAKAQPLHRQPRKEVANPWYKLSQGEKAESNTNLETLKKLVDRIPATDLYLEQFQTSMLAGSSPRVVIL